MSELHTLWLPPLTDDHCLNSTSRAHSLVWKCALVFDRREIGDVGAFDSWTDEQLVEEAVKRARALGPCRPRLVEDDNKKPR
jgi:hypothetical protein